MPKVKPAAPSTVSLSASIEKVKLSEIRHDGHNANRGSARGDQLIAGSISEFGFAEAGTLDRHNVLIGGNRRTDAASSLGMNEAIIIDTDGTVPVYIRRTDLDLSSEDDPRARLLAYALNVSAQQSINLDPAVILADVQTNGLDLSKLFTEAELAVYLEPLLDAAGVADADDAFGAFGDVSPRDDTIVAFKFGSYSGPVERAVYDDFCARYESLKVDSDAPMMTDVLRIWLNIGEQDMDKEAHEESYAIAK